MLKALLPVMELDTLALEVKALRALKTHVIIRMPTEPCFPKSLRRQTHVGHDVAHFPLTSGFADP